jgi:hypothetical protein
MSQSQLEINAAYKVKRLIEQGVWGFPSGNWDLLILQSNLQVLMQDRFVDLISSK